MEPYCNMNSSNGRYCHNPMNQGCRTCDKPHPDNVKRMLHDGKGRNMEVECVCQVTSKVNCHKNDPMEKLGNQFPVVMAYVPWQQWGELYDADCGLMQGTIFKDLNKIFCGVRC